MNAAIVTIGDEILNGDTIDTNSSWIAKRLNKLGVETHTMISIADKESEILSTFENVLQASDITICTGGLGPTNDDLTIACFARFFSLELVEDKSLRKHLEKIYTERGFNKNYVNEKMVNMPAGATILQNSFGAAPGLWQEKNGNLLICLPGIPYEMKGIMEEQVIPKLKQKYNFPTIRNHYFMTAGKGETTLSNRLQDLENQLPDTFSISYLPTFDNVKVRLTAKGEDEKFINEQVKIIVPKIREKLKPELYSEIRNESLSKSLARLCNENKVSIGTVESCTGGAIAHEITSNAGSSSYFLGSIVSYANSVKENIVGVKKETIEQFGAVSEQTVYEMVQGGLEKMKSDYVVATSGIAGPGGGSKDKAVGLVCIGVGNANKVITKSYNFAHKRKKNIQLFTMMALNLLLRFIKEQETT